jgi:cellobiose PTS system EIIC component
MSKLNSIVENKIIPFAGKVGDQRHLRAMRDGIVLAMPLLIIGSLFLIIGFLPIPGYEEFMAGIFGDQWLDKLLYPVGATFDIMALIASFGIAYRLAESYKVDGLTAGAISVSAFLLATPYKIPFTPEGAKEAIMVSGGIPTALTGSAGLFVAMLIAMLSTEIYRKIVQKNLVIKMPDGVPPSVGKSFIALVPGFIVIAIVWILRLLIENTSFESLHNIVGILLGKPLSLLGGSLFGILFAIFLIQLFWSTGLHGSIIVGSVLSPVFLAAMDQNRVAFQAGQPVPNIVTDQFIPIWIDMGGSGATLALVTIMLIRARSKQLKSLGKLAVAPALFNINEPIIFGFPMVMNPLMAIPFILVPLINVLVTYLCMSSGLVAKPVGIAVPWTMPPIIGGYLATGGKISGAVMQLVNFTIALLIYYPFFRIADKQKVKEEGGFETSDKAKAV